MAAAPHTATGTPCTPVGVKGIPLWPGLNFYDDCDVEHLSVLALDVRCSNLVFILHWLIHLLLLIHRRALYILDISPSSAICAADIFSQFMACPFIFLKLCFDEHKI